MGRTLRASRPQPFLNPAFTFDNTQPQRGRAIVMHRATQQGSPGIAGSLQVRGFRCMESIRRFFSEEDGQDVVEYGLLIATIAIVVLIGVGIFGNNINAWFQHLAGRITTTGT